MNDPADIGDALRAAVAEHLKSRPGATVASLARDAGIAQPNLHRALQPGASVRQPTVTALCRAMGLRVTFVPVVGAAAAPRALAVKPARERNLRPGMLEWVRVDGIQDGEQRTTCGRYALWVQERGPRGDAGRAYGASLVATMYAIDGKPAEWLCDAAPLREAKDICQRHADGTLPARRRSP